VDRLKNPTSLLPSLPPGARILVIRHRSIGDIILLTPALRLLKDWRPDLHVSVIVERRFRELLENNPDVEEILEPGEGSGLGKVMARVGTIRDLRRKHFDLCVNLHGGPTSVALTAWGGASIKAGFEHFRSTDTYDVLIPDARLILNQPTINTAEHQASAFFHLGLPRKEIPRARIVVAVTDRKWWLTKRTTLDLPRDRQYVMIHPTALYLTKQWSLDDIAALGKSIESELGLLTVYSCGPGEQTLLDSVERAAKQSIRRLEGAGLRLFAAALSDARLFIGNDSGPAHMAAALGLPGVVIFGSSSSVIWGPWRPAAPWRVVQNPFDCNPCPGDRCYKFELPECILSITLQQVRSAVDSVLAESHNMK